MQGDGTLMAGDQVRLNIVGDLANSGTIAGRSVTAVTADNIRNLGGRIEGGNVTLVANTDLDNLSGTISGNTVALQAGRDVMPTAPTPAARWSPAPAAPRPRKAACHR